MVIYHEGTATLITYLVMFYTHIEMCVNLYL